MRAALWGVLCLEVIVRVAAGLVVGLALMSESAAWAQKPTLLPERDVAALANELSGETAKRNLEGIARFHRQRGSAGFHAAAELVAGRLRAYGLSDVEILKFPADGKIFYGTQRSRPAWDAEVGELWEVNDAKEVQEGGSGEWRVTSGERKIASYEAEPVVLAEDSESADVTALLVDVGEGTKESDYAGKDVDGRIVLVGAQPGAVQDLAVGKFGAVGIVSYAQNQRTAWSGEDENLIRWGHLETFSANKTFGFMVSLKTARALQARLARGEKITLHAVVKAGQHAGNYEVVTAVIPGLDAKLKEEEIAFSCHLDHQRPGANDNTSGCATILEVARTLAKLTADRTSGGCTPIGKIDDPKMDAATRKEFERLQLCHWLTGGGILLKPARTIRFIFPPEVEGTMALLNARPEFAARIKAVIHMDMVGGGPETKAVFHVTRGPMSLPSFVHDVAWAFADWVNEESYKFAATGTAEYPMVAPEGGKEPLRAEYSAFSMGSDHEVYQDSSFGIPAIYLNDWPDRYIHTNFDTAANIDTTKLKRAGFIGAASGYFLAGVRGDDRTAVESEITIGRFLRDVSLREGLRGQSATIACTGFRRYVDYESEVERSFPRFLSIDPGHPTRQEHLGEDCVPLAGSWEPRVIPHVYRRKSGAKGPLTVFGYDYFEEKVKVAGVVTPKLLSYEGRWGGGEEYAYEIVNFADGERNALEIWDAVSAEYGPVPYELVVEYLEALEKIGVVAVVK
jgi:aminopeptidase YwaD